MLLVLKVYESVVLRKFGETLLKFYELLVLSSFFLKSLCIGQTKIKYNGSPVRQSAVSQAPRRPRANVVQRHQQRLQPQI